MVKLLQKVREEEKEEEAPLMFREEKDWHIYVFGGSINDHQINSDVEIFSVNQQKWTGVFCPQGHY